MSHLFVICSSQRKIAEFCRKGASEEGSPSENALMKAYPMTHGLLPPKEWQELLTGFFASHTSPPTTFWKMPRGLCDFAKASKWGDKINIPYLSDLLELEWIEIEVYMMSKMEKESYQTEGDLMQDVLYVNPEHRFQICSYPIFEKCPLPADMPKGEYHLFCFRHPKTSQVHFLSLSPFYRSVLQALLEGEHTGKEAAVIAAKKWDMAVTPQLLESVRGFYQDLFTQEAILGFLQFS